VYAIANDELPYGTDPRVLLWDAQKLMTKSLRALGSWRSVLVL